MVLVWALSGLALAAAIYVLADLYRWRFPRKPGDWSRYDKDFKKRFWGPD